MKDICCIGHITHDRIITPQKTVDLAGGTSFYFARGLSCLPPRVSFQLVTKGGTYINDEVERMRSLGIDVTAYSCQHTVFFENKYGENSDNRQQRVLATAEPFTLDEVRPLEAKVFHLGSLMADDFPLEVVRYLSTKGQVSIDVQGYLRRVSNQQVFPVGWKDKEKVLECTDYLKLNEHEMEVIASSTNPRSVALELASYGVGEVIITLGSYGSLIYADDRFHEIPGYPPRQTVDATGCGDTYAAGYLYARARGASCEEAGRLAAAMCTLKLEHTGPFDSTIEEARKIISTF